MKKIIIILAVLMASLNLLSGCFAEDLSYGDFSYTILPDGTAEILRYRGEDADVTIPETLDGFTVTSLAIQAFARIETLRSVVIPDSVTTLGDNVFGECTALESVNIPEALTWMGSGVFQGCVLLEKAVLPAGLIRIGWNPFDRCDSLRSIEIAADNPFYSVQDSVLFARKTNELISYPGGRENSSYEIPEWVTSIGMAAFSENKWLREITLNEQLEELSENPFCGCKVLAAIHIPGNHLIYEVKDGALYNKQKRELIAYLWGSEANTFEIPAGTLSISQEAFYKHPELTHVTIPNSVRFIGNAAFAESGLLSIRIPEGVTVLRDSTFSGCHNLLTISLPRTLTTIGSSVFYECISLIRIELPSSLRSIGSGAFYLCQNLLTIKIPEGVESVGNYAFTGCFSLTDISFPESLTDIGNDIFYADENILLSVPTGSYAETWAEENGISTKQPPVNLISTESI